MPSEMPAPVSIIIPTYNVAANITPTLDSLMQGVSAGLIHELIFADGGSTDETQDIAESIGAAFINAPKGRGNQLSEGAKIAKGSWFFVVHADTQLSDNWANVIADHIETSPKAGYARLRFQSTHVMAKVTATWANLRSKFLGLPYGDQTLLISKSLYTSIGGYPDFPLMEDVEIAHRLKGQLIALPITATTSASRYTKDGWIRRGWCNLGTLLLFLMGYSPEKLVSRYNR